jgi:hypothetical protein
MNIILLTIDVVVSVRVMSSSIDNVHIEPWTFTMPLNQSISRMNIVNDTQRNVTINHRSFVMLTRIEIKIIIIIAIIVGLIMFIKGIGRFR